MTEQSKPRKRAPRRRRGRRRKPATNRGNATQAARDFRAATPVDVAARRLGIQRLYPEQQSAIADSLAGRDVLMVLPTGFGKSACYQIPSMVLPRPVVVISPLLALMRDQHDKLVKRDVPCVRLDGTIRGRARREALERVAAGKPVLVMTTPETLGSADVRDVLSKTGIGLAAVDEAHCISEWGFDFRPSYLQLGSRLQELGAPPLLALTATATQRVRTTIVKTLRMRDPSVVAASPHRSNLAFEVIGCEGDQRLRALVRLLKRLRRPGVVYCATRREVDAVHGVLRRLKIPAYRYQGGMTSTERDDQQGRFMRPQHRSVMVATNAFGLGIDKPDIRYILHYQSPASLEQYVQEAGRAGRDGRVSNCILLHDPADRKIHEALLARSRIRPDQLFKLGRTLAAWSSEKRSPSLQALAVSAGLGPRIVASLLNKMEEAELVHREDSTIELAGSYESVEDDTRKLAGQFETLRVQDSRRLDSIVDYVASTSCRAVFLRDYFGEDEGEACGLCDSCRDRTRPATLFAPIAAPKPARKKRARGRKRRKKKRPE